MRWRLHIVCVRVRACGICEDVGRGSEARHGQGWSHMWRKEKKTQEGADRFNFMVALVAKGHNLIVLIHYTLSDILTAFRVKLR